MRLYCIWCGEGISRSPNKFKTSLPTFCGTAHHNEFHRWIGKHGVTIKIRRDEDGD